MARQMPIAAAGFARAVRVFAFALFLMVPFLTVAQSIEDFDSIVDFRITLKELSSAAESGQITEIPGWFYIVDGAVASRAIVQGDRDNFIGELEVVSGEWVGVEAALMYSCIVQLVGSEFYAAIPARRSRRANPAEIALNSRVLIVGKLTGLRDIGNGKILPVLRAFHVRTLN